MKIDRNSWHYKLIDAIFKNGPSKSLCWYFWQIPISLVAWTFILSVMAMILSCGIAILTVPIWTNFWPLADMGLVIIFGGCSVLLWHNVIFQPLKSALYDAPWNKTLFTWPPEAKEKPVKDYKPNLIWEFIKAKKQKVCPTLEFYYGDK